MPDSFSKIQRIKRSAYRTDGEIIIERLVLREDFPLHWHDHYELEYILSGSGTHVLNGKRYRICPGTLHYILPTDLHALRAAEPLEIVKVIFQESDLETAVCNMLAGIAPDGVFQLKQGEKVLFDTLFQLCAAEAAEYAGSEMYPQIAKRLLEAILMHLIQHCKAAQRYHAQGTSDDSAIGSILIYLHRNFRQPVTLTSAADYAHFSPSYLSKYFRENVGVTFKEYLTTLRLQFSAKLLSTTDCSITEVCFESGFRSLSNFINTFRKAYHISPSAYRKQLRPLPYYPETA